jgi:hypothetical protein
VGARSTFASSSFKGGSANWSRGGYRGYGYGYRGGFGCWGCGFGWGWGWGFGWGPWWGWGPFWGWGYPAYPYWGIGYGWPGYYDSYPSYDSDIGYNDAPAYNSIPTYDANNNANTDQGAPADDYLGYGNHNPVTGNVAATTPTVLIYLTDGTTFAATDYWLADGQLHYYVNYSGENSVDMGQVDLQRTVNENAKRGVRFSLKPNPDTANPAPTSRDYPSRNPNGTTSNQNNNQNAPAPATSPAPAPQPAPRMQTTSQPALSHS